MKTVEDALRVLERVTAERDEALAWQAKDEGAMKMQDRAIEALTTKLTEQDATLDAQRDALRQTEAALSRALATVIDRGDPFDGDDWSVANEVLRPALAAVRGVLGKDGAT